MTLRDLGLDPDLERLYRLVLALHTATTERLADAIAWEPARTADAVGRLDELGLVRVREGEVQSIEPGSAVGSLIEHIEDDLLGRYRRVSATRTELAELVASHAAGREPGGGGSDADVERITDLAQLRDKIEELSFFTRSSLCTVQPGGPTSPEALEASRPLDDRGLRRGISMRIIREPRALGTAASRTYLLDMVARGAQVRTAESDLHQMLVMDEKVAIVPIDDVNRVRGALIIRQPVLVAGFCDLFERTWAKAVDIAEPGTGNDPGATLSEQDRQVLRMLATGVTDEVAARELAISVRHLRRHVSRLMGLLEASSRFAAGVEAGRRGWI